MKSTDFFKKIIKQYLEQMASIDNRFAAKFDTNKKSIDECCNYIIGEISKDINSDEKTKSGNCCIGINDDEVYSLAVHYYMEDDLKVTNVNGSVVIVGNQIPELTEEDKAQMKSEAMEQYKEEVLRDLRNKSQKKQVQSKEINQPSLFD